MRFSPADFEQHKELHTENADLRRENQELREVAAHKHPSILGAEVLELRETVAESRREYTELAAAAVQLSNQLEAARRALTKACAHIETSGNAELARVLRTEGGC